MISVHHIYHKASTDVSISHICVMSALCYMSPIDVLSQRGVNCGGILVCLSAITVSVRCLPLF